VADEARAAGEEAGAPRRAGASADGAARTVAGAARTAFWCVPLALALLAAAWQSPRVVPYNMDEFVHYHALGCAAAPETARLPLIRDGCGFFDLRPPFWDEPLPLRSYYYIGSFPALPFYPLWRAVSDPVAVRLAGAVAFVVASLLACRLLRVRAASLVIASLVFPVWLVTFVVDEGPVGLSVVCLLVALLSARRAFAARAGRAAAWAAGAGFALFLGLWTKLVFAWWLPAFAVFLLAELWRSARPAVEIPADTGAAPRRVLPALGALGLAMLAPLFLLLASTDRAGRPYLAALRDSGFSAEPDDVEAVALRLSEYLTRGSLIAPRNVLLDASPADVLPLGLSVALLLAAALRRGRRRELAGSVLLAAATFAFVAGSGHSRWPHHFAFPLLPLVLALALALDGLGARARLAAALVVACFWATLALRLPAAQPAAEASPDKDRLLAYVREQRLDRATLQVHATWGTYYIAQLFGDPSRQLVYMRRVMDDPARLRQVGDLARREARPVLLVSGRRWDRLHTVAVEAALGRPERSWRFGDWWLVEYRPRPAPPR
jgi:hypothetical protein